MPPFLFPPPPWPVKPPTARGYRDAGLAYALGWRREIGRRHPGRQRWGLRPKTVRHPRGDFDDALEQLKSFKAHWEAADEP